MFNAINDGMNSTLGLFLIVFLIMGVMIGFGIFKYFLYVVCAVTILILLVAIWVVLVLVHEASKSKKDGWW